jgi:hypothetical protein
MKIVVYRVPKILHFFPTMSQFIFMLFIYYSDWNTKTNQATNCLEQSPSWEADSHSASQEIPGFLWNPKVHYRVHNSPPLVPILNQIYPDHNFPHCFSQTNSNIIFPSTPRSCEWSLPFKFPDYSHRPFYLPVVLLGILNLFSRVVRVATK